MRSVIFLLSLFSLSWPFPYKDLGDSANGQREGKWIEYTEESRASYHVREGNYVNGKRDGIWYEKRISWNGEVYDINKLQYSKGMLLKREKDYAQEYEIKRSQEDARQAAMNAIESELNKNEKTITTYPREQYKIINGPFVSYYKNGNKHEEGMFKDGKLDGPYILYTKEGSQWELHTYKEGILDGEFVRWFYNSKLKWHQRNYKSGLLDGYALTFFENGRLKEKTLFSKGLKQGESLTWYKNGKKQKEATYLDDKENGVYRFWYENGQIRDDAVYDRGKLLSCKHIKGNACIQNNDSTIKQ
jgi:antitoxin component YwqK of YwqJK toxin-antitoxin module